MRQVKRLVAKPQSLSNNALRWTEELLAEIKKVGDVSKVSKGFLN